MRLFDDIVSRVDDPHLALACSLALRGEGLTAPNPAVGCVIVSDGEVVGEGFHARCGGPHAEVVALQAAGHYARGADAYVTLEPCGHHGKTPPCADALIAAGISRVVIGMADPTALAGGGASRLTEAGCAVEFADDSAPFVALNEGWMTRESTARPFVTAKAALSLDARVSVTSGERAAMTGPAGGQVTRMLRSRADAVLVGAATVISDDPALTVRDEDGILAERQPLRVVVSGERMPSADATVFTDGAAPTLLVVAGPTPAPQLPSHVEVVSVEAARGLDAVLELLAARGVCELLVEPGPKLLTALWESRLLDSLVVVTAGGMAGAQAPAVYDGPGDVRPGDALAELEHVFMPVEAGIVGDVSVTVWRPGVHTNQ